MGRGNAQARAAQVQAQLAAAAATQAEIAKQALDAVDAGTEPAIAAELAVRAATEASQALKEGGTMVTKATREIVQDTPSLGASHTSRKIRIKDGYSGPPFNITVHFQGSSVLLPFGGDGIAEVLGTLAEYMVHSSPGEFEFVEE